MSLFSHGGNFCEEGNIVKLQKLHLRENFGTHPSWAYFCDFGTILQGNDL